MHADQLGPARDERAHRHRALEDASVLGRQLDQPVGVDAIDDGIAAIERDARRRGLWLQQRHLSVRLERSEQRVHGG